jgi:hypothetical protein
MIIYREQRREIRTAAAIASLQSRSCRDHESLRDLLIDFGDLECGIADALPSDHPAIPQMRRIAIEIGRAFHRSYRHSQRTALNLEIRAELPPRIEVGVAEGYAYYGLFPETYVDAAEQFFQTADYIVIGIRSIGTSLSAAVAGTLAELGGHVESFTIRPTGHPFHRAAHFDRPIDPATIYLLVDEGPGLSGSSLGSVADALSAAGVPDARIVFFPSWNPDPDALLSLAARDRFRKHRSVVAAFDPEIVRRGLSYWRDVSAAKWRDILCTPGAFPAVQPQHERRKFLHRGVIAKFAGFGSRGKTAFDRARSLHDAGFIPSPLDLTNGFLFSAFVPGRPVEQATPALIHRIADYLNHIQHTKPSLAPVPCTALSEMLTINLSEILNIDAGPLLAMRRLIEDAPTYNLDGRMLPHEWIETPEGFLKTDAVDHFDDHFFPGPQDIAWDVAAAMVEFSLDETFLRRFDPAVRKRVPFYLVAYSAFRLAYCRIAEKSAPAEVPRFRALASRYETVTRESPLLHHLV